jgi:hypothetical protein
VLYTLSDPAGAALLLVSAATLLVLGNQVSNRHELTREVRQALLAAAGSISCVAAIYAAFTISVDVGVAVRPWAKMGSGVFAMVSAVHGTNVIRLLKSRRGK